MSESSPWEIASEQQNVDCFILNIFTKQRSDGLSIVGRRQNCHRAQAGGVDLDGMDGETPLCGISKAKKTEQLGAAEVPQLPSETLSAFLFGIVH